MEINMKVFGMKIKFKDKASLLDQMEIFLKETGLMIKLMD